ncbi:MAG: low molecular weight phosphotyrosine protein phosphatase [Bacteroidetes bacterium]|nr:low molecular weight phosphotyrosine protein phosphatase [Rhodothermia bacterium]MCX7906780.1 low molecular weight phosphotyrosine protein phosphatase [Bacteroidota bacterium]MDW8285189.1 low molecular weight protein-tyrosine-phosphatase [Bacteroidota bacterium]
MNRPIRVLFVCLGNICRSPMAEGIFRKLLREVGLERRFEVDSAGTSSWHVGEPAHPQTRRILQEHGADFPHRARQFGPEDLEYYDHILVMDKENLRNVLYWDTAAQHEHKVRLLRAFDSDPEDYEVPDPWGQGRKAYEHVYAMLERSCRNLLKVLVAQYALEPLPVQ